MSDLIDQPWEKVIDPTKDCNEQAYEFDKILEDTLERHAPLKRTKVRKHFRKGLSERTKQLMHERDNLRKIIETNGPGEDECRQFHFFFLTENMSVSSHGTISQFLFSTQKCVSFA